MDELEINACVQDLCAMLNVDSIFIDETHAKNFSYWMRNAFALLKKLRSGEYKIVKVQ